MSSSTNKNKLKKAVSSVANKVQATATTGKAKSGASTSSSARVSNGPGSTTAKTNPVSAASKRISQTTSPLTSSKDRFNRLSDEEVAMKSQDFNNYLNAQYGNRATTQDFFNALNKDALDKRIKSTAKETVKAEKNLNQPEYSNEGGFFRINESARDRYTQQSDILNQLAQAKATYDGRQANKAKQAEEREFKSKASAASYEGLMSMAGSQYLSNDQRRWADELARQKASSTQATGRMKQLDDEMSKVDERLNVGFDLNNPMEVAQYQSLMNQKKALQDEKNYYEGTQWMRERDEDYGSLNATKEQASIVQGRQYNNQYRTVLGLADEEEVLWGRTNDPTNWQNTDVAYRGRDAMTDQEKYNYSYLYNKYGEEKANDYLEWLSYDLNERLQTGMAGDIDLALTNARNKNYTGNSFVDALAHGGIDALAFVGRSAANLSSGLGYIDSTVQKFIDPSRPIDTNRLAYTGYHAAQAISQNQLSQIDSGTGRFAYQTLSSMLDSGAIIGLTAVGIPGAVGLLGGAAATDSLIKAKERGATDSQALTVALFSGAAETIFEDLSLEKLFTTGAPANLRQAILNILTQGGTEGSEEFFTTLANTFTDAIIMGDKSELNTMIRQYKEAGYSEGDAQKQAWLDWTGDLAMDALGGFVSGAVFGTGGQIIQGRSVAQSQKNIKASTDAASLVDNYQDGVLKLVDENGVIPKENAGAYNALRETYVERMNELSDRGAQFEESVREVDRMVEREEMTAEEGNQVKAFLEYQDDFNRMARGEEQAAPRNYLQSESENAITDEQVMENNTKMVEEMANKSAKNNALLASPQVVLDNYDGTTQASDYFGAWRYYETMGMQAQNRGEDNNFAYVRANDTRYANALTNEAAITAYAIGYKAELPAATTMTAEQKGTGTLVASEESLKKLATRVKSVDDAVSFLKALAEKTGLTITLDNNFNEGEHGSFMASAMTLALNPEDSRLISTAFHELSHDIEHYNAGAWNQLKTDMLSWWAQTKGMADVDSMLRSYAKSYKGMSRVRLETEACADAFGSLFNGEDAAKDLGKWLYENKSVEEANGFVEKLEALIDRVVNWFKSILNLDNVSPMQKRTVQMELKQAQAFRKAFLEAVDTATRNAETMQYFEYDGDGHDMSVSSLVDGLGYKFDTYEMAIVDKNGNRITKADRSTIEDSKIGGMLKYAFNNDRITQEQYDTEVKFFEEMLNLALENGENNIMMYWEIAGTQVFSALKDNSDKQYGLTVDMSTICAKTKAIVDIMSETMMRLERGLTREEIETIYYVTGKNGEPTPCPMCYVFSRWFGIGGLLEDINQYQQKYANKPTKELVSFANRIMSDIMEFKDNSSQTKKEQYWSSQDNAWKIGRIASDYKSKLDSWADSREKANSTSDAIATEIATMQKWLEDPADNAPADLKKKMDSYLNKKLKSKQKSKRLLSEEQYQANIKAAEDYRAKKAEVEAWQWLTKTMLKEDENGKFVRNEAWDKEGTVPPDVLFNLNNGAEFAEKYPLTWAYRTSKGSAMGKAITPYADVRVGEIVQGVAKGKVGDILIGDTNPFNTLSGTPTEEQKKIFESAVKKAAVQNLIGGTRFQSTSDFRYEYGSDYLMAFLELQAIGSNVQLYTKVIEAVDFLASMNADINLSAMPLGDGYTTDENGVRHLVSSPVTGINFGAAVEMSRKYDNVQIIMVGINRNHILTCLEGDEVTFVIPFHGSGQNTQQIAYLMDMLREDLDVTQAQDYTNYQSDHDMLKEGKKEDEDGNIIPAWKGPKPNEDAKAMRQLRKDILTGKLREYDKKTKAYVAKELTAEQKSLMAKSKFLGDLYNRFYVDENAREYGLSLASNVAEQVFPYEYWDKNSTYETADVNGDRFVEYCAEIGYMPRFTGYKSDGTYDEEFDFYRNGEQKGYWKLLIDRPMYANTYDEKGNWTGYGKYREQQAINVSKFKAETISPKWQKETYGDVMGAKNHSERVQAIAAEAVNAINEGLRYDTESKALVQKGQEKRPGKTDYSRDVQEMVTEILGEDNEETLDNTYFDALKEDNKLAMALVIRRMALLHGMTEANFMHGSSRFGFTKFEEEEMENPWIFVTDDEETAKGYAEGGDLRDIGKQTKRTVEDVLRDYEQATGQKAEYLTPEKRKQHAFVFSYNVKQGIARLEEGMERLENSGSKASGFDFIKDADDRDKAEGTLWDMRIELQTIAENLPHLRNHTDGGVDLRLWDRLQNEARDFRKGIVTIRDILDKYKKKYNGSQAKLEIGDFLAGSGLVRIANNITGLLKLTDPYGRYDEAIAVGSGNNIAIEGYQTAVDLTGGEERGIYSLIVDPGDNVLIINEGGGTADWTDLPVPWHIRQAMENDGWDDATDPSTAISTDMLAEWAKDLYTSIYIENISDNTGFYFGEGNEYILFHPNQVKSQDLITYDDDGNVIPPSKRFDKKSDDMRYSKGKDAKLNKAERKALEARVREAERNAKAERERADYFKSELKQTPKYTPDAKAIESLATELSEKSVSDTAAINEQLRKLYWNANMATEKNTKKDYAGAALSLAKEIATDIVVNTMGYTPVTVADRAFRDELIEMKANAIIARVVETKLAKSTQADKWAAKLEQTRNTLAKTETYAVNADNRYDRLESEYNEYRQKMRDKLSALRARRDAEVAFIKQGYNERIENIRARRDAAIEAEKQHRRERVAEIKEEQATKELRKKVTERITTLRNMVTKPNDKTGNYVPEPVKEAVLSFLTCIDNYSKRLAKGGNPTKADYSEIKKMDGLKKLAEASKANFLGQQLDENDRNPFKDYFIDLPPDTIEAIERLEEIIGTDSTVATEYSDIGQGVHLRTADYDTLALVDDLVGEIIWAIKRTNRLFQEGKYRSVYELSQASREYLKGTKDALQGGKALRWTMATPYYAFKRFGDSGEQVFMSLVDGLGNFAKNINVIKEFKEGKKVKGQKGRQDAAWTDEQKREWSNDIVTITAYDIVETEDGKGEKVPIELKMTTAQAMCLYGLTLREAAREHLYKGGIVLQQQTVHDGLKKTKISQETPVHLDEEQLVLELNKLLSPEQRALVNKMVNFLSTTGSEWGNHVSMARWGKNNFTEKHYWPMKTYDGNRQTLTLSDDNTQNLYAMANQGFTKPLQEGANNALIIGNAFDVFTDQATNMAKYNAMVLPMLDAMKWFNWNESSNLEVDGQIKRTSTSLKGDIRNTYGGDAIAYFRQFMADLNNPKAEGGVGFGKLERFLGNYKAAAVGANLRVALLQPTAFFRAGMVINPAWLIKGAAMKGGLAEMEQHSGIYQWKDFGYTDTDVGRSVRRMLSGEDTRLKQARATITEKSMWLAEMGDKVTWAAIWNACKLEQKSQHKGVSYDELMKLTEARFNEVVLATQVFDSTLSRSEVMRRQDPLSKIITAFLSEPTLSYNMVMDKFVKLRLDIKKYGKGKAWKMNSGMITKALAIYSVTNLAAAIAESLMDAIRDDDDDPFLEKFLNEFLGDWSEVEDVESFLKALYSGNFMSDMTVLGKIPIAKEVVSLFQGYDLGGRMDIQAFQNLANAYKIWHEKINLWTGKIDKATSTTWYGNMTTYGAIYKTLQALSQVTGLPVSNGMRDIFANYNTFIAPLIGGDKVVTYRTKYEKVEKALRDGAGFDYAVDSLVKDGLDEDDIISHAKAYIGDLFMGEDGIEISREEAKQMLMDNIGLKADAAEEQLNKWTVKKETGYSSNELKDAYMSGDITEEEAVKYKTQLGVKEDKAKDTVAEWKAEKETGHAYDEIDNEYLDGDISRKEAIKLYEDYGVEREKAEEKVYVLDFIKKHPEAEGISYSAVREYEKHCVKAGTPVETFMDVRSYMGTLSGDKKDKVLKYINSKSISSKQKDSLYYACGYAESKIDEAPWH